MNEEMLAMQEELLGLIESKKFQELKRILSEINPADIALFLEELVFVYE